MIQKASEQNYENEKLCMILYGLPGVGKTTLAASAPKPIVIDCDRGMKRVNPKYRCDVIRASKYEELLEDVGNLGDDYETVIIDTGGALIDFLKDWAERTDKKATKKSGGFSQDGYGTILREFSRLASKLRLKYHTIFVFHAVEKWKEDEKFFDLAVEGQTRNVIWNNADIGAFFFIMNGERYLGFSPTENYKTKSSDAVKGLVKVPELSGDNANNLITTIFAKIKDYRKSESEALAPKRSEYDEAMNEGRMLVEAITCAADIPMCLDAVSHLKHALTSEKEIKALVKDKMKELGITYNKETKTYEDKAE